MPSPLRVLIAEDSPDDAELMLLELAGGGFDPVPKRVETAAGLRAALAEGPWDVVLSDHTMPGFGASEALALCREADPDLPFLVVSGTIGEEQAVEMMRAGARDYILKGNLGRLAAAVESLYGWTAEEAVGRPISFVVPPGQGRRARWGRGAAAAGRAARTIRDRPRPQGGRPGRRVDHRVRNP